MKRLVLLLAAAALAAPVVAQVSVRVDYGEFVDPPLIKTKFGVYQTPLAPIDRMLRDLPLLGELEARTLRFETAWGKTIDFNPPSITGTPEALRYDRTDYTRWVDGVVAQGARPLLTHSYTPVPLQQDGDWRNPPTDLDAWERVNEDYARYWYEHGLKGLDIEIWNEPDLSIFFLGTREDYFDLYRTGARGARAGHPDAKIGGPVTAFSEWYSAFLAFVRSENLPLDFLSGHAYANAEAQITPMRNVLGRNTWPGVEMWLTEYAAYPSNPGTDIRGGGAIERFRAAADFLDDVERFLAYPELTRVYWAQWSDIEFKDAEGNWTVNYDADKMGFVDVTGEKKAIYNAFALYNRMPVDRNAVQVAGGDIGALASSDTHNAAVLLWNPTETAATVTITLDALPFEQGTAELYRIDADHASFFENRDAPELAVVERHTVDGGQFSWTGALPGKGTLYLALSDGSGESELDRNEVARVVRTDHWFQDRGNTHYADFDPHTWTARLGMGKAKDRALAQVGVTAEELPARLYIRTTTSGMVQDLDANSLLGVRIDYGDGTGTFTGSVLFHGGLYHAGRTTPFPWGTGEAPDEVVQVEDFSGFVVDLAQHGPAGVPERAVVSFVMQNTGSGSRAKMHVTDADSGLTDAEGDEGASSFRLGQNRPNPFGSATSIRYHVAQPKRVRLEVFDALGRSVATLVDAFRAPGSYDAAFDASRLASGVYTCRMQAGRFADSKQMVLLR